MYACPFFTRMDMEIFNRSAMTPRNKYIDESFIIAANLNTLEAVIIELIVQVRLYSYLGTN